MAPKEIDFGRGFDFWGFAREAAECEIDVPVASLARLVDVLATADGHLTAQMTGRTSDGCSLLDVAVAGSLQLICQRCLEVVEWPVEIKSTVRLAKPDSHASQPEKEVEFSIDDLDDVLVVGPETTLESVVEDEVLLGLPISATHERCSSTGGWKDVGVASPFAVLRIGLKNSSKE